MATDKELNQYKKASKRAAFATLFAFIFVAIAIIYNTTQLNSIEAANSKKLVEIDSLSNEIKKLDQTVADLMYSKDQRPHVYVDTLTDIKDVNGKQLYDFTLWVDSGAFQKKDISQVEYKFNSSVVNDMISTESSNGFSVHFRGTECLKNVDVTIVFSDNSNKQINFDMCEELNWSTKIIN
jgi:hypothetical protein